VWNARVGTSLCVTTNATEQTEQTEPQTPPARARLGSATCLEHAAIQLGILVPARADNIWTMVWHIADDRVIRDIYPFYTHQMVWLADVSPGLQAWLDSGAAQGHFLVGT
jgi:hypothetical protein